MKKRKKTESSIAPYDYSKRTANNVTFDSLGVLGSLGPSRLEDGHILNDLSQFCDVDSNVINVNEELISFLLDMGVPGSRPNELEKLEIKPVGLRQACCDKIDQLAQDWSSMIEKLMDVFWLSLRRASRVLQHGGVAANELRQALRIIFNDDTNDRSLEHFLAQTAFLLNDWTCIKPRCPGCKKKSNSSRIYGYPTDTPASQILCKIDITQVRSTRSNKGHNSSSGDAEMTSNDSGQVDKNSPILDCQDGDVLLRVIDPDTKQPVESNGLWQITRIWKTGSESPVPPKQREVGWLPAESLRLLFGRCTCGDWYKKWKPFTDIVTTVITDVARKLPNNTSLFKLLKDGDANLSTKAMRRLTFIRNDLRSGNHMLPTSLSTSFLAANIPEVTVAF